MSCKDVLVTTTSNDNNKIDTGNKGVLEEVVKFCYFSDMLSADRGCDSAITARVRCP